MIDHAAPGAPALLAFAGDLDIYAMEGFRKTLEAVPAQAVVIDFSGVTYVEAATVGELMRLRNRLNTAGHRLCVVARPDSWPHRVFEICGTLESLCVCASVEIAFERAAEGG